MIEPIDSIYTGARSWKQPSRSGISDFTFARILQYIKGDGAGITENQLRDAIVSISDEGNIEYARMAQALQSVLNNFGSMSSNGKIPLYNIKSYLNYFRTVTPGQSAKTA